MVDLVANALTIEMTGSGLRGESQADILRRTGQYGVLPTDTDEQAMAKLNATAIDAAERAEDAVASAGIVANPSLANHFIFGAGNPSITGSSNVLIGPDAGDDITTGIGNTSVGVESASKITNTNFGTAIGYQAGEELASMSGSVVIGALAASESTGALNDSVVVGVAAAQLYNGADIVAIGRSALTSATGANNIAIGRSAGNLTTSGQNQTILGYSAQGGATFVNTIAIGYGATATKTNEIAIGNADNDSFRLFDATFATRHTQVPINNWWIGASGPPSPPSGWGNLSVGIDAMGSVTSGYLNLAIGPFAGASWTENVNTVAIGAHAGQYADSTGLGDSVLVGVQAGQYGAGGAGFTAVGFRSQQMNAAGANNTTLGDSTLWLNQQSFAVGIGYIAGEFVRDGVNSVLIGGGAGTYRLNAERCTFIGPYAGSLLSNEPNTDYTESAFMAEKAANGLDSAILAAGGKPAGMDNVGIGYASLIECLGSRVTAIGVSAGASLVGSEDAYMSSVYVGFYAGNNLGQKTDAVNQIVIGSEAFGDRDNQVVLGNASITETVLRGVTRHTTYTVANLPSASAMGAGARSFVTDANATTFNSVVAGGGSNAVPVFSDGTAWRIG